MGEQPGGNLAARQEAPCWGLIDSDCVELGLPAVAEAMGTHMARREPPILSAVALKTTPQKQCMQSKAH